MKVYSKASSKTKIKKLILGCGLNTSEDWINVDGSWNAWLAKHPLLRKWMKLAGILPKHAEEIPWNRDILIHDVRKPLPFQDNSLQAVYASHLLEHLYLKEAKQLLRECFRTLQPGGILRIVVPDLKVMVTDYLKNQSADQLNERLLLRSPEPSSGNFFYRIYSSLKDFHSHKWMYDADSLSGHLREAGFLNVQEKRLFESAIEGIEKVEQPDRILNGAGICVEAIKPGIKG